MTLDSWPAAFTARVAQQMREARRTAGLTMAEVAQGCTDRGLESTEQSIKNLESGRKASMTIADFVVLADVLGVPPVSLLFPLGTAATVEVLPGREMPTWDALAWFAGETPMEQPAAEGTARDLLDVFRNHGDLVAAAMASTNLAKDRRRTASTTLDRARRVTLLERAAGYEEHAFEDCQELRVFRARMNERGLVPPALPGQLAFVDQPGPESDQEHSE
ncbi:helix-turn-helix transcriptional regulator [Streptomyces sp. SID13666]|uniref:helix-turn-helix domain-containing protein n=1 Tax=unclassified Streptomyces TaxID=2593676 RepID=UPI0013C0FB2B|nr:MULTISPECIES: helix-turn-helix transcriptional regulator [unclassified Streptomyces]NEA56639.1 helix-turn-helix transcriptional regulator [Streptomyces sp. SID13666]NEA73083.1 helix-turn-helix transcriptional regulator [Streptomyces sp. SID13588]